MLVAEIFDLAGIGLGFERPGRYTVGFTLYDDEQDFDLPLRVTLITPAGPVVE